MAPPQYIVNMDVSATWTNKMDGCKFFVLYKTNLTDSAWATNSIDGVPIEYPVTNKITQICFTNNLPKACFKLTDGNNIVHW